ncbi:MAG: hypothetical protein U9N59_05230 [Campylobacterota bacterium]|nr:hypothetical protein [Campylobacterota bacterium]
MTKKIITLALTGAAILVMSGCSAKGPQFSTFQKIAKQEESIVYFYRPDSVLNIIDTTGVFEIDSPDINYKKNMWDSKTIGKLRNNSFFKYKFKPGKHKFTDNMFKSPIEINLKPNDYTCVKVKMGLFGFNSISEIDKYTCEKEIKTTLKMTKEDLANDFY